MSMRAMDGALGEGGHLSETLRRRATSARARRVARRWRGEWGWWDMVGRIPWVRSSVVEVVEVGGWVG